MNQRETFPFPRRRAKFSPLFEDSFGRKVLFCYDRISMLECLIWISCLNLWIIIITCRVVVSDGQKFGRRWQVALRQLIWLWSLEGQRARRPRRRRRLRWPQLLQEPSAEKIYLLDRTEKPDTSGLSSCKFNLPVWSTTTTTSPNNKLSSQTNDATCRVAVVVVVFQRQLVETHIFFLSLGNKLICFRVTRVVAFVVVVVRCSFKLGKETWIGANFSQLDISCCAQGKTRPGRQRNKLFQLHQSLAAGRLLINMTHEPVCCSVPIKANVSLISATIRRNGQHLSRLLELIMASFCSNYNEKERERLAWKLLSDALVALRFQSREWEQQQQQHTRPET